MRQAPHSDLTDELIRRRAYEISQTEGAGTAEANWRRAEEELRAGSGRDPHALAPAVNGDDLRAGREPVRLPLEIASPETFAGDTE